MNQQHVYPGGNTNIKYSNQNLNALGVQSNASSLSHANYPNRMNAGLPNQAPHPGSPAPSHAMMSGMASSGYQSANSSTLGSTYPSTGPSPLNFSPYASASNVRPALNYYHQGQNPHNFQPQSFPTQPAQISNPFNQQMEFYHQHPMNQAVEYAHGRMSYSQPQLYSSVGRQGGFSQAPANAMGGQYVQKGYNAPMAQSSIPLNYVNNAVPMSMPASTTTLNIQRNAMHASPAGHMNSHAIAYPGIPGTGMSGFQQHAAPVNPLPPQTNAMYNKRGIVNLASFYTGPQTGASNALASSVNQTNPNSDATNALATASQPAQESRELPLMQRYAMIEDLIVQLTALLRQTEQSAEALGSDTETAAWTAKRLQIEKFRNSLQQNIQKSRQLLSLGKQADPGVGERQLHASYMSEGKLDVLIGQLKKLILGLKQKFQLSDVTSEIVPVDGQMAAADRVQATQDVAQMPAVREFGADFDLASSMDLEKYYLDMAGDKVEKPLLYDLLSRIRQYIASLNLELYVYSLGEDQLVFGNNHHPQIFFLRAPAMSPDSKLMDSYFQVVDSVNTLEPSSVKSELNLAELIHIYHPEIELHA